MQKNRKIVFVIEKASGIPKNASAFVFFSFNGIDFHTNPLYGPEPVWNYHKDFDLEINESVLSELKSKSLEFVLFDDNVPIENSTLSMNRTDIIGKCTINLSPLLVNEIIDIVAEINDQKGLKIGSLKLKVFWHDGLFPKTEKFEDSLVG